MIGPDDEAGIPSFDGDAAICGRLLDELLTAAPAPKPITTPATKRPPETSGEAAGIVKLRMRLCLQEMLGGRGIPSKRD